MALLRVKINNKDLNRKLNNTVSYSYGFLDGVDLKRIEFNRFLGGYVAEALGKYIDAKARSNSKSLHHVYEPGCAGSESDRLFSFGVRASETAIYFDGKFLPSKDVPLNGGHPFIERATVMENGIGITIAPVNSNVLVFDYEGDTVFTTKEIYIEHPGGPEAEGSFGSAVDEFFNSYFTNALLKPLISNLNKAEEFTRNFAAGTRGGKAIGVKAGREYLSVSGLVIE